MSDSKLPVRPEIPRGLLPRFKSVLSLPDERLRAINEWAKAHLSTVIDQDIGGLELRSIASEIGISRSDLLAAFSVLGTVLVGDDADQASPIDSYVAELREIGLGDVADKARVLLDGIEVAPKTAEYVRQKGIALQSAVPTLAAAEVVCDLRGVFRRFPSPSPSSTHERNVKTLLGLEPVVLVRLDLNNPSGLDVAYSFQATETGLRYLLKTLREAATQLEILRERVKLVPGSGEVS